MKLSVIIPFYNEGEIIHFTLKSAEEYLNRRNFDYEIIVISDGSRREQVAELKEIVAGFKNARLIDNEINHGKGYVVRQAMLEVGGDLRLFMDADNSTTIDNLDRMMPLIEKGYDVVIASIGIKGSRVVGHEPMYRRLFGKMSNLIIQILVLPGIWDTQRGFKLFTARAAETIFRRTKITGWGFDIEVLALARKFKYKIGEIPIVWNNSSKSAVNLWAYPGTLLETLKIRWNLWTGKYECAGAHWPAVVE